MKGLLTTSMGTCLGMLMAFGCAARQKADPEQSQIRYQLAVGYYRDKRVEAASEELRKALQADPENADAYNMLGIIALHVGHDYVVQVETSACLKGQDAASVRGDATGKFREAEQHFRKAVEARPEFPEAWNNLAVASLQLQDWDAAIAAARNALKDVTYTAPETARANLGWAHFNKKELQHAWKELHESVARAPANCVGRYRLAKVYVERNDMELAAEMLEPVVSNKNCPIQEAHLLAGLVYERRKDRKRARTLFQQCADIAMRSCVADECRRYSQMIQ